eukprot:CAMPEP_0170542900 /NCGR_PEP_ID=MMETSP0211-20121228/2185_1 /TAXON_ID=311385 /ORGANISM="Pseudokeronopsis sp., Strain OXSARD2" /LENGTH=186 /DNA_ID=CAMNT_0010846119 /DNA_START=914 /DNA_END=1474 /DNA_ORIENTATION=-
MNYRKDMKVGANQTLSDSYEERLTYDKKLSSNIKVEDLYNVSPESNLVRLEYEGEEEEKEYESVGSGRNENDIKTIEADSLLEDNFDEQVQIRLVQEDQMLISPKSVQKDHMNISQFLAKRDSYSGNERKFNGSEMNLEQDEEKGSQGGVQCNHITFHEARPYKRTDFQKSHISSSINSNNNEQHH